MSETDKKLYIKDGQVGFYTLKSADKIFEEIGYKKYEHNLEPTKSGEWITQDEPYIKYLDEKVINGTYYSMFMMNCQRVQIGGYEKGTTPYGKPYERVRNPILNLEEIKAISLKVGELGWMKK